MSPAWVLVGTAGVWFTWTMVAFVIELRSALNEMFEED